MAWKSPQYREADIDKHIIRHLVELVNYFSPASQKEK